VSNYLKALEANKPKRGRKRTAETVKSRLSKIDAEMREADALSMLNLRQEKLDLQNELATMSQKSDLRSLEADFVKAAKGYSARKGITYGVWRQSGVAPEVLKKAGISR
jgi:hypothetical protein